MRELLSDRGSSSRSCRVLLGGMMVRAIVMAATVMLLLRTSFFSRSRGIGCVRHVLRRGNGRGGRLGGLRHDRCRNAHDGNSGQGGQETTGGNDHIKILQDSGLYAPIRQWADESCQPVWLPCSTMKQESRPELKFLNLRICSYFCRKVTAISRTETLLKIAATLMPGRYQSTEPERSRFLRSCGSR
ncbi:hypothetical protein KOXY103107_09480 [Komagataeibacter xylinus]